MLDMLASVCECMTKVARVTMDKLQVLQKEKDQKPPSFEPYICKTVLASDKLLHVLSAKCPRSLCTPSRAGAAMSTVGCVHDIWIELYTSCIMHHMDPVFDHHMGCYHCREA